MKKLIIMSAMILIVSPLFVSAQKTLTQLCDLTTLLLEFETNLTLGTGPFARNCHVNGTPTLDTTTAFVGSNSYKGNADGDSIECQGLGFFENGTAIAAFNQGGTTGDQFMVDRSTAGPNPPSFELVHDSNNARIRMRIITGTDVTKNAFASASGLETNTWGSAAGVKNVTGTTYAAYAFHNGSQGGETGDSTGDLDKSEGTSISIGGRSIASSDHFIGNIDEVAVWNISLTTTEIKLIFDDRDAGNHLSASCTVPAAPTCDCPSANTDWNIGDGSICSLTTVCDIGTGKLLIDNGALYIDGGELHSAGAAIDVENGRFAIRGDGVYAVRT